ncbi:metallophosphoesterase family protein [Nocardia otitidiscaviarum]|uniref:metallophosphoesterase family protein n=1 Tax=Nocardia otitidiscaviarum TaxID=1823 RepID=UPI0007C6C1BD|nr:metallophosphoesterase family protein [Nocardia otitidiscaviarum]
MTGIWFTSDLHVGHVRVAELRGFPTTAEHDTELARRWDAAIRPDDHVWVLGDVTGRRGTEPAGLEWIAIRPGTKHLIAGNHDPVHGMHTGAHKAMRAYLDVFATVMQTATRKISGARVLLSHFPYANDPDGDHTAVLRHLEYRMPDTGQWLLHGHTHSPIQQRGRQLHVGVDAHDLTPVPLKWVEERIAAGVPTALTVPMRVERTGRKVTLEELEAMRDSGNLPPRLLDAAIDRARQRLWSESSGGS